MKKLLLVITLVAGVIAFALPGQATALNLTSAQASGFINGAFFYTSINNMVFGTGVFDPFVQLQGPANGTNDEKGYNTDGTLEYDTTGPWTHSLQLQTLVTNNNIYTMNGIDYYEFVLDINEPGGNKSLLTLHELEFYISPYGSNTGYPSIGTKKYDLDALTASQIDLDANLTSGSGKGCDMVALIPTAIFGTDYSQYLYLYSAFGSTDKAEAGFEEWAHMSDGTFTGNGGGGNPIPEPATMLLLGSGNPIPEPATMLLLGSGLIGIAVSGKKRLKKRNG